MRRRAIQMTVVAVVLAVLLLGIPAMVMGSVMVWRNDQAKLDAHVFSLSRAVERRLVTHSPINTYILDSWHLPNYKNSSYIEVEIPGRPEITAGEKPSGATIMSQVRNSSGAVVTIVISAHPTTFRVINLNILILGGIVVSLGVGWALALRGSRIISAPLIYLAAQAEQIGTGQVRPHVKPSGIEEIDLVQAELVRTADRMASRLGMERQFAANASHQLRTPLTALSMRLEEIELISKDPDVRTEAHACLEQVERLTGVVDDLLKSSRSANAGTAQAIRLQEVFDQQNEEWSPSFSRMGRELIFTDDLKQAVLASPGSLGQVLATLLENSLNYGAGTTRVLSRKGPSSRSMIIEITDEGEGIDEEIAPDIFNKGVSGHGSTGIGLALAKDLMQADGGRIDLTRRQPPMFTLSLPAVPASVDISRVLPQGALVSVGRRRRGF